jgi:hypothetical protein
MLNIFVDNNRQLLFKVSLPNEGGIKKGVLGV